MKLTGKTLGRSERDQLQSRRIIVRGEPRSRLAADASRSCVGDEPFSPLACKNETMPVTVSARFEENHRARVPRGVARIADLPDFPFPAYLERDIRGGVLADVAQRHHRNLAPRLVPHVLGDPRDRLDRSGVEYMREIVDDSRRRGNCQMRLAADGRYRRK
jgi:hypothetical protein